MLGVRVLEPTLSKRRMTVADEQHELIRQLFAEVIPEIAAGAVEVRAIARIPGVRSRIAVSSNDPQVDPVGVCTGKRVAASGPSAFDRSRITTIFNRLDRERLEILRWSDTPQTMIANALVVAPESIENVILLHAEHRAIVTVKQDLVGILEGPRGESLTLASRLSGWDIELRGQ
jgi:N utilization substance protein A